MGEPMRWLLMGLDPLYPIEVIDGPALSNKSVRVREDGATEADIERVVGWIEDFDQDIESESKTYLDCARELLALVFGEEASRV